MSGLIQIIEARRADLSSGVKYRLAPRHIMSNDYRKNILWTSTHESRLPTINSYLEQKTHQLFNEVRLIYDTVVKIMWNFRQSGHPGGAISVGPQLIGLFLDALRYDIIDPDNEQNDVAGLASGHKTNGLYALLTILFEAVKLRDPNALPKNAIFFKDMLGFRRNKTYASPLVEKYQPVTLDGHPLPETPFVRVASGASGYAVSQLLGYALGLRERFCGDRPPIVYILEGADGGFTTGRTQEAYQAAHNMKLENVVIVGDFNNTNIDENKVAGDFIEGSEGKIVSWSPEELAMTHGGNVVTINDGHDFNQVIAGYDILSDLLKKSSRFVVGVFRTIKAKDYDPLGLDKEPRKTGGRKYHGAGHAADSLEYFASQKEFENHFGVQLPRMPEKRNQDVMEEYLLKSLNVVLEVLKTHSDLTDFIVERAMSARDRIPKERKRSPAEARPLIEFVPEKPLDPQNPPPELILPPGKGPFRGQYVKVAGYLNQVTNGAFWVVSADLLSSTLPGIAEYLGGKKPEGGWKNEEYYYGEDNRESRILHGGGITEDVNAGLILGLGAGGVFTGVSTSFGAFQSLAHTHVKTANGPAGSQERQLRIPVQIGAFHVSLWTGPDGARTHADPQSLSTWRENFPYGSVITLVPIDPNEIFSLLIAAYRARPTAIVPFIARPDGVVYNREKLGFSPATGAVKGGYILRPAKDERSDGTIVLQGPGVAKIFIEGAMPKLDKEGWNPSLVAIVSHELFRMQDQDYRDRVLPYTDKDRIRRNSVAITEFTEGTVRPYVDDLGLRYSLFSYKPPTQLGKDPDERESIGPYGSDEPEEIFKEAGLHAESQFIAVKSYLERINRKPKKTD